MATTPLERPVISGTAKAGMTLSGTIYGYQWNRSPGGAIPGASGSTYIPVAADVGHTLSLTVGSFRGGVLTSYDVSASTAAVTPGDMLSLHLAITANSIPIAA